MPRLTWAGQFAGDRRPRGRNTLPALTDRLGDPDPVVRLHVAQAVWEIDRNGYPILPVLVDLLLTNRADTRIGAVYTLGRMGSVAGDTDRWLTQLLNDSKSFDRLLLAETIVRVDSTRHSALEILVSGLRSRNADVRYLSTIALGAVPLSRMVVVERTLQLAAKDRDFHVRCAAHETLGHRNVALQAAHHSWARSLPGSAERRR